MSKNAHFNPKSLSWLISLAVMIVACVAVIFGSKVLYNLANQKYIEPVEISFTIEEIKDIDISSTNASDYNVTSAKEAYDANGELVAYVIDGTTVGYNKEVPIEMSTIISADASIVCKIDIIKQKETEYLGVRIATDSFKNQFEGRYLPIVSSTDINKGSKIDMLANSTVSSQAVIDAVNNAKAFVLDNYASSDSDK